MQVWTLHQTLAARGPADGGMKPQQSSVKSGGLDHFWRIAILADQ